MASSTPNDSRVTARLPASVKDTLQKAADLIGATLNQFFDMRNHLINAIA